MKYIKEMGLLIFLLTFIATVSIWTSSARAYELLMFSVKTCHYCMAFMDQVEPEYHDTEYAKTLPLTIIDNADIPEWFQTAYEEGRIENIRGTPTFIIWDEESQAEIDRIVGYGGKDEFFARIAHWIDNHKE